MCAHLLVRCVCKLIELCDDILFVVVCCIVFDSVVRTQFGMMCDIMLRIHVIYVYVLVVIKCDIMCGVLLCIPYIICMCTVLRIHVLYVL